MLLNVNCDERWAEVDLRELLAKGGNFDAKSDEISHKVEEQLGIECGNLGLHHFARYVCGVVRLVGREVAVAVGQHCRLVDNKPPRAEWEYQLESRGEVKAFILTPGMQCGGTGLYLYNSPSYFDVAREVYNEMRDKGWDGAAILAATEERARVQFDAWYDGMAAQIKADSDNQAYMDANQEIDDDTPTSDSD